MVGRNLRVGFGSEMKILVVGCGSIGERHIKNLKSFLGEGISACDIDERRLAYLRDEYQVDVFKDYDEALSTGIDCVFVCTPTDSHIKFAKKAVESDCHVFVEKPISNNLDGVDDLIQMGEDREKTIYIGFNYRFDDSLKKIKEWLDEGRIGKVTSARSHFGYSFLKRKTNRDYREDYAGKESQGGGVILDVIHEIDYLTWLLGDVEEVFCYSTKISQLDIDVEDLAEISLKFKNDAIGSIHLDFIQLPYQRDCRIIGQKGTIEWDFPNGTAKLYNIETEKWQSYQGVKDWNNMYLEEAKHFIRCVRGEDTPITNGSRGKHILTLSLAAKESAKKGKPIKIL